MDNTGTGYLRVSVSSASGALPVAGAIVLVFSDTQSGESGEIIHSMRTNSSGTTPTVSIGTPPKSETLKPGAIKPYTTVNIQVNAEGYYKVEIVGVPVFDGTVSEQRVNLIPRSTAAFPDEGTVINETPKNGNLGGGVY